MRIRNFITFIFASLMVLSVTGCSAVSALSPTETPTETPLPTQTSIPTMTPTATEIPFYVDATVWSPELKIPILIYHQFVPDHMNTEAMKMRLSNFREQLQILYDQGFTLISLKDWLSGIVDVPVGRKPLILTMDDLWFGNQIFILPDGTLSPLSGIGVLWRFSQEHPDFGFHAALFAIYGDKYYPERQVEDQFYAADGVDFYSKSWHIKLGETIAWAMDNGLEVYNHTFLHIPALKYVDGTLLTNKEIQDQLAKNDYWVREFLTEAGREDYIPRLDNLIALPEGKWPETQSGIDTILNYKDPEGKPVMAVMEAYNLDAPALTPSYFDPDFDPYHLKRITASRLMLDYIIEHQAEIPVMQSCRLGPLKEEQVENLDVIREAIQSAVDAQTCPAGIYTVSDVIFIATDSNVTLFKENASVATVP